MSLPKLLVIALWIACAIAFLVPAGSGLAVAGQRLFWGLLVVHAIECVLFLPRLRAAGGSLGEHLWKTLVFGFFYVRDLRPA